MISKESKCDIRGILLATMAFAVISTGTIAATFQDAFASRGYAILWAVIPLTLLFSLTALVNGRHAVPRLLMHGRYRAYILLTLALGMAVPLAGWALESMMRQAWNIPQRILHWHSPWILIDAVCNSVLVMILLIGTAAYDIFLIWKRQTREEEEATRNLDSYMAEVKSRLNPDLLLGEIDGILGDLRKSVASANRHIHTLCATLRQQLYEMPAPDAPHETAVNADFSPIASFLTARKYRIWRYLTLTLMFVAIAADTFFDAPDRPVFSADNFISVIALLAILCILALITAQWLFRRFCLHGYPRRYLAGIALLILCIMAPIIIVQILTFRLSPYSGVFPWPVMALSACSTAVTLTLFLAGISGIRLLQFWIRGERRMVLLKAETARQEYLFLKKQINPHFLFNVLNNIGILSEEDTDEASAMLLQLRQLLEFQFRNSENPFSTVADEMEFIRTYLELQSTRMDPFGFDILTECDNPGARIPSLVLITFVENAVKHGAVVDGCRTVNIFIKCDRKEILFECRNTCGSPAGSSAAGGVGLANTRRRLDLIYGDRYSLDIRRPEHEYSVTLRLFP